MKTIDHDEMFANLKQFLQARGIDLKEGSYTRRLQQGCGLLTDLVNTTHRTVTRARAEVDRKLKDIRETLHRKTSSKKPTAPASSVPPPVVAPAVTPGKPAAKTSTRSGKKPTAKAKAKAPAKPKRTRRAARRST